MLPQIRSRASAPAFGLFEIPAVGDTLDFGFSCITQDDFPNAPTAVTGIVRQVSARAVVVEDTTVPGSFTSGEYAAIAANFDDPIYDTDVTYFGAPGDIDQNGGRVVLLYSGGVNQLSESYDEGFIAGFTCPLDLGFPGGNDAEMFYLMVPDPTGDLTPGVGDGIDKEDVLRFTDNTVAHEFQHLINAQTGNVERRTSGSTRGCHTWPRKSSRTRYTASARAYLGPDELLGTLEEQEIFRKWHLAILVQPREYLMAPPDTAVLPDAEDPLDFNTFACGAPRGCSCGRARPDRGWDCRRVGAHAGSDQSAASDSRDAVTDVFGIEFDEMATDWAGMLVIEDRDDVQADPDRSSVRPDAGDLRVSGGERHTPTERVGLGLRPNPRALSPACLKRCGAVDGVLGST